MTTSSKRYRMLSSSTIECCLVVGQRVRLSGTGRACLGTSDRYAKTGKVSHPAAAYPDSISVVRDGSKTPLQYHKSYWEPMN